MNVPIDILDFDRALAAVQQLLNLRAVVEAYGANCHERSDGHVMMTCVLPSREAGFSGTCAQQDGDASKANAKMFPVEVGGYWRWHCYSCRRGGDVVDFIAHAEGWPLNDQRNTSLRALRRAAGLAGVDYILDGRERYPGIDEPKAELTTSVDRDAVLARPTAVAVNPAAAFKLNRVAAEFWRGLALSSADAIAYMAKRGITEAQAKRYAIGYAPKDWRALTQRLPAAHHALAVRLGLLAVKEGRAYDTQRHRLIFPYLQLAADGEPVFAGFAGRRIDDSEPRGGGKFCNSLNVDGVWTKQAQLFGVWQASARASKSGRVVVCEGPSDVLAFDRIGVAAVGLVGAAMTLGHAMAVRALGVSRVTLALDGDATGRNAAATWVRALLHANFTLEQIDIIDSDDGEDPDETAPDVLRARFESPIAAADWLTAHGVALPQGPRPASPEASELETRIAQVTNALRDNTLGNWQTHAEFKAWHERNDELRQELARLRKQLAAMKGR